MRKETACGAIVHRQNQEGITEILLTQQKNGLTAFPKGHMEPGETEVETARRETLEETGLEVSITPEPRSELRYIVPVGTALSSHYTTEEPIDKTVVLFLATPLTGKETPQDSEIAELIWVSLNEVENRLTYPEWKEAWLKIKPYLESNSKA